jgi:hypothetical protein
MPAPLCRPDSVRADSPGSLGIAACGDAPHIAAACSRVDFQQDGKMGGSMTADLPASIAASVGHEWFMPSISSWRGIIRAGAALPPGLPRGHRRDFGVRPVEAGGAARVAKHPLTGMPQ